MKKDLLGVDIGSKEIKLVYKGKTIVYQTPDNCVDGDELIAYDGMSDVLKTILKENNIKAKNASLVLPDSNVFIERIKMPYMTSKQLDVNLPYEFKDVVGKNKDDYLYDYAYVSTIYDDDNNPVELELVVSCIKKSIIEKYSDCFKKANLKLVRATPRQMAISNVLNEEKILGNIVLLDLGYNFTRIDFFKDGLYDATRILENGIKDMNKIASDSFYCDDHLSLSYLRNNKDNILESKKMLDYYDDLTLKINRAINYYLYENRDANLDKLYVYGGGINFNKLYESIKNDLNIEVLGVDENKKDGLCALGATY